jgi:hypothetical protein
VLVRCSKVFNMDRAQITCKQVRNLARGPGSCCAIASWQGLSCSFALKLCPVIQPRIALRHSALVSGWFGGVAPRASRNEQCRVAMQQIAVDMDSMLVLGAVQHVRQRRSAP